jgi:hypothetical protein
VRTPIDAFILARLEKQNLAPSPEADRATLIRRLNFDLIGLPPRFDEVESFAADNSPQAYESLVDRLLNRPQFGERWARHWLDVARYSDTKGYVFQEDRSYKEAYTYRDWIIQSINRDLPYDQFLKYQLAADQLPTIDGLTVNSQAAMGFLTLGRRFLNNKHDIIDDRIDVVTRGMLGLTVTCARCHDHKYDPIPTADYYSLYGVFASSDEPKNEPCTLRLVDSDDPHDARILVRGRSSDRGDVVPRRFLAVLSPTERQPFQHGSGRVELAEAIANSNNPLTARVMVNRVWLHLFGKPLVGTPSDFGTRCDPPLQPEVLDVLAVRFMEEGWSVKKLIRRIVLSSAYRQSSAIRSDLALTDPENRLVWRQNRRRLDLESLRDAILSVSEQLDPAMFGPSVDITTPPFARRRTVYAYVDRQNLPSLFRTFDFASPDTHSPQRLETTTPQQSLFLMNHPFVLQQSEQLCKSLQSVGDSEKITALYRGVLARNPSDDELRLAINYVLAAQKGELFPQQNAWEKFAQVLLLTNEFQFVLRRRLRHEVVHASFRRDGGGGEWIVSGDHDGLYTHRAKVREALAHAAFDDVLQVDDAEQAAVLCNGKWRSASL